MLTRKEPRDFVHLDEFQVADDLWKSYFLGKKIWIFVDEYRGVLPGDLDYSRIVIHRGDDKGWLYSRRLEEQREVHGVLEKIIVPVSEAQLKALGFIQWEGGYIQSTSSGSTKKPPNGWFFITLIF